MSTSNLLTLGALLALWVAAPSVALAAPIVDVGVSRSAGCAVREDGALFCYGFNDALPRDLEGSFHRVPTVSAKKVAVGANHVCVVDPRGDVLCAGGGAAIEVLPGSVVPKAEDIPNPTATNWRKVQQVSNAVTVETGPHHTCALTQAGDVFCWGSAHYGRLGPTNKDGTPAKVPGLGTVKELSVHDDLTCVLSTDKKVRCFGQTWVEEGPQHKPGDVVTLVAPPATSVGAGSLLACALLEDGSRAVCAGSIDSFTGKETSGPETVKLPEKAKGIVGGGPDLCFLGESGKLWCSGLSQSILARTGELAPGAWAAYSTPLSSATMHYHDVLAIGQDGSLLFAGAFDRGPRPTKPVQRSAVGVLGLTDVVELAAGEAHACARRGDGTVQCWGGSWEDSAVPRAIPGLKDVVSLDAGGRSTCARLASGTITCFSTRHVANRPSELLEAPTKQPEVAAVGVGGTHACLLDTKGKVSCWGSAYDQSLGYQPKEEHPKSAKELVAIAGLSEVTQLDAGSNATCALTANGSVRCWGRNENGVLGQGTFAKSAGVGEAVVSLPPATHIALGRDIACALGRDGRAHCWGSGALAPIPWPGAADVIDVAAGGRDSAVRSSGACIVRRTGKVECGLPGSARTIRGVDDATSVVAGGAFACALLADKTVKCWGKRDAGQLGDGRPPITTTFEPVPLP
jgi:alpha-tubulin suppressor-like RCC1 family protein